MVEVVDEVMNKLNENGKTTSPKDIIQVYCQLKCDNEELTSLKIYQEKRKKIIRIKANAQHLLDWLIIRSGKGATALMVEENWNYGFALEDK
ncbi:15082_t:CDS:2 [Funneliformis geosporum]|uniref:13791_t:CDS:1 n=1 Tax=Funneliformis geosporum TaxID=1117311 RepID=A0A9W4X4C1_9GLOM|nr:13791_t:CDS:2 [Funneliformis geosporum]CAI2185783.1 15082_t:CDS:2 [Funneliformis geosporum]